MCHYKHLTIEERESLYLKINSGESIRDIARELGRSPSTISRELKRGRCGRRPYSPSTAQIRYEKRRKKCGRKHKLSVPKHRETVRKLIEEQQTLVDRKTRYTAGGKTASKEAEAIKERMIEALSHLPQDKVKSVTPDRGREFARHGDVTKALPQVEFYFPQPYSPWERGTNENTNGLIREFLPKGYDMAVVSDKQIEHMLFLLNTRPRKCLNWLTPMEAFFDCVLHLT